MERAKAAQLSLYCLDLEVAKLKDVIDDIMALDGPSPSGLERSPPPKKVKRVPYLRVLNGGEQVALDDSSSESSKRTRKEA